MTRRKRRASVLGKEVEVLGGSWVGRMRKGLRMTTVWGGLTRGTELPGKKKGWRGTADQGKTKKEGEDGIAIENGMDIDGGTGAGRRAQVARRKGRDTGTGEIAMRANGGGIAKAALLVLDAIVTGGIMTTKTAEGKGGVTGRGGSVIGLETVTRRDGGEGEARALVGRETLENRLSVIVSISGL